MQISAAQMAALSQMRKTAFLRRLRRFIEDQTRQAPEEDALVGLFERGSGYGLVSEQQFAEWYGVQSDGWIRVGETVSDPNNYGGTDNLWVYYFETESGKQFVVGGRASQDRE